METSARALSFTQKLLPFLRFTLATFARAWHNVVHNVGRESGHNRQGEADVTGSA